MLPNSATPNPYHPPITPVEDAPLPKQKLRPPRAFAVLLLLIGCGVYLGFIVALFDSTRMDQLAGVIFAVNVGVLVLLGIWEITRHRVVHRSYTTAVIIQLLILSGMLTSRFGDPEPVTFFNLMIAAIAGFFALASFMIAKWYRR